MYKKAILSKHTLSGALESRERAGGQASAWSSCRQATALMEEPTGSHPSSVGCLRAQQPPLLARQRIALHPQRLSQASRDCTSAGCSTFAESLTLR
jgi:hypothetical protein